MTPEQLATLLAKAVPEMRWAAGEGSVVCADRVPVIAYHLGEHICLQIVNDNHRYSAATHTLYPREPIPEPIVVDAIVRCVGRLLPDADRATWGRGLYLRAQVLLAERHEAERRATMDAAIKVWQDSVSALRSAQAHLEAVQDG